MSHNLNINLKYKNFLEKFLKDPTASFNKIATSSDLTQPTVKSYFKQLSDSMISTQGMKPEFTNDHRSFTGIHGHPNYEYMGLELFVVNLKEFYDYTTFKFFKETLRDYPYIAQQIPIQTPSQRLILVFLIPPNFKRYIIDFCNLLQYYRLIRDFDFLTNLKNFHSTLDYSFYDEARGMWQYISADREDQGSINSNFKLFLVDKFSKVFGPSTEVSLDKIFNPNKNGNLVREVSDFELQILEELQYNGRVRIKELKKYFKGTENEKAIHSRRVSKLKSTLIGHYWTNLNYSLLGFTPLYIIGSCSDTSIMKTLYYLITENKFPFASDFYLNEDRRFFWQIFIPIEYVDTCIDYFMQILESFESYSSSEFIPKHRKIDTSNYDTSTGSWKGNERTFIDIWWDIIKTNLPIQMFEFDRKTMDRFVDFTKSEMVKETFLTAFMEELTMLVASIEKWLSTKPEIRYAEVPKVNGIVPERLLILLEFLQTYFVDAIDYEDRSEVITFLQYWHSAFYNSTKK